MMTELVRVKQHQDIEWTLENLKTLVTTRAITDANKSERMLQLLQKLSAEWGNIKEGKTEVNAKRKKQLQKEKEEKEKEDKEKKAKDDGDGKGSVKVVANPLRAVMEEQSSRKGTWALYEHMRLGAQLSMQQQQQGESQPPQQGTGDSESHKTATERSQASEGGSGGGLDGIPASSSAPLVAVTPPSKRILRDSRRLSLGEIRSSASDSIREDGGIDGHHHHHHKDDASITSYDDFEVDALDESAMLDIEKRFKGLLLPRPKGLTLMKGKPKAPQQASPAPAPTPTNANNPTNATPAPSPSVVNSRTLFSPGGFRRKTKK